MDPPYEKMEDWGAGMGLREEAWPCLRGCSREGRKPAWFSQEEQRYPPGSSRIFQTEGTVYTKALEWLRNLNSQVWLKEHQEGGVWGVRNRWRDVRVQFTEAERQAWTQDTQGAVGSQKAPPTSCRNLKGLPVAPFDRWGSWSLPFTKQARVCLNKPEQRVPHAVSQPMRPQLSVGTESSVLGTCLGRYQSADWGHIPTQTEASDTGFSEIPGLFWRPLPQLFTTWLNVSLQIAFFFLILRESCRFSLNKVKITLLRWQLF